MGSSLVLNVIRCDDDGIAMTIDTQGVVNGEEVLLSRSRLVSDDPVEAITCIAAALFPLLKFEISDVTPTEESNEGPTMQ